MVVIQRRPLMLYFLTLLSTINGARILGIFPVPAKSHNTVFVALTDELARRGHQVTVISSFPKKPPLPNLTDIEVRVDFEDHEVPENMFDKKDMTTLEHAGLLWSSGISYCPTILGHPEVQKLIHSTEEHFDAIIVEAFMNECLLGFAHKFKAPIIQICPFGGTHWMGDWVGNPYPYSYVPDAFLDYSDRMNFLERLVSTITSMFWRFGQEFYNIPRQEAMMRQFFNHTDLPPLSQLVQSTSLLLVNNHFSLNYPRPLVPNLVQVGGMHVKAPKKLPQDLQKYLDDAPHGAIYFSMGSILRGSLMPQSKREAFLSAFSKLKQRILWKWETDSLPGQPSNVKLSKWLPQGDILAHPNVKLFITHGGLLSKQEAMTYGIPLVGIPIFGDQRLNMRRAEDAGYGILLDFENITADSVLWAIEKALEPSYRHNAQRVSKIYRDQPLTPLETAVFWTEYVIRHKGASHMRSAALELTWYQYFLLDVIALLSIIVSAVLILVFMVLKTIFRAVFKSSPQSKTKVSKNKKKS